jgi:flagellar FliL protein
MAEESKEEQAPAKKSKLPLMMAVVVVLGGAGAGGYFFLGKSGDAKERPAAPAASSSSMGPIHTMNTMIVNLDEPGGNRYLKVTFDLELTASMDNSSTQLIPRLRDRMLVYLSSLTVDQVQKRETKLAIKKKLKDLGNEVFGKEIIKQVYFKSLVMQ